MNIKNEGKKKKEKKKRDIKLVGFKQQLQHNNVIKSK